MPKNNIDYSNTIIYKIYCNDNEVKYVYIGHTTNFSQRKCCHKNTCNNIKSYLYNLKIYKFIREHGGWDNWTMIEIAKYNCKDSTEARIKEQYHYKLETLTLNSIEPNPEKQKHICNICNINYCSQIKLNDHYKTNKHFKNQKYVDMKHNNPENAAKFECIKCSFICSKKSDWDRHIFTQKHQKETNEVKMHEETNEVKMQEETNEVKMQEENIEKMPTKFLCDCGKEYKYRQSLFCHKKRCQFNTKNKEPDLTDKEIIKMLIKENSEFKHIILDIIKLIHPNNTNNTQQIFE